MRKVKGVTAKPVKAKVASKGAGIEQKMDLLLGLMEKTLRVKNPDPISTLSIPDFSNGSSLRSVPVGVPTQNDEWTREMMMAKISTLETRVETMAQVLGHFQKTIASLTGGR
jgi:hypothetical protein